MSDTHESCPSLSIVIPVYKSEGTIGELVRQLSALEVEGGLEIILVNDGSPDGSGNVCRDLMKIVSMPITLIEHARNFGEHNAVMSGLRHARGSYVITMDDDLQNPPEAVVKLYNYARSGGWDVAYTWYDNKRHALWRNAGSYFANIMAESLLPKPKGLYLSSFRCLSAFVVDEIVKYTGPFPYVDGIIVQVTNSISAIQVDHFPRIDGKSGYTLSRLMGLWLSMATGFSLLPLRIAMVSGAAMMLLGLISICGVLTPGWGHFAIGEFLGVTLLVGGAQSIFLGVVGEYVGRTLLLSAGKPQAVIRSIEVSNFGSPG